MATAAALTITLADYDLTALIRLKDARRRWQEADPTHHGFAELSNEIRELEAELCGIVERLAKPYGYA